MLFSDVLQFADQLRHTIEGDLGEESILREDTANSCRYLMNYSYNPNGDLRELEWGRGCV